MASFNTTNRSAESASATATTPTLAVGATPVDEELLHQALHDFIASALPEGTLVVQRYAGGPKPLKAYVDFHLTGPAKPGQAYFDGEKQEGLRTFKLTVRAYADKQALAMRLASAVQTATERDDLLEPLQVAGYSFGEVGEIQDTTTALDTKWEAQHQFEADVFAPSVVQIAAGQIDVFTATATLTP